MTFLNTFRRDDGGTIAIIFALSSLVLFASMSLAVDYARNVSVHSDVQSALDDALLSAAAQSRRQDADPIRLAKKYFAENWTNKHKEAPIDLQISQGNDGELTGTARVTMPTMLAQIAGFEEMKLTLNSSVKMGEGAVELVLALDTTGSMSGSKLETLKTSSNELVETLFSISNADERIKIGVVPFAQYVNVGLDNRNASWMTVDPDQTNTSENCYDKREVTGTSNCRTETATATNDGVPYTYTYETCDYEYGDPTPVCEPETTTIQWNGCAGSRSYPLNIEDETYTTRVPGVMNVTCGTPVLPLSREKGPILDTLNALNASGETYIPSGLAWGWRALSPDEPFSGGVAYGAEKSGIAVRKILVLMTDGANTKSPSYPSHDGTDQTASDSLAGELCANIKTAGIEIYTVAFDVDDDSTKSLMQSCATSTKHYFDASSSEELRIAFVKIAKDVTPLRLTH